MKRLSAHTSATLVTVLLLVAAGMAAGAAANGGNPTDGQNLAQTEQNATDGGQNATDNGRNATVPEENVTDGGNLTIVNLGENATLDAVEGVSPQEPTVYVGPNVTIGPNNRVNVTQTFVLGGEISGWQGVAPESINGTVNPTLNLTAGEQYAISWANLDGAPHNVVVTDQNGTVLARTEIISGQGGAQTLVFEASYSGTYYCVVHPSSMRGDVVVAMNVTANGTAGANTTAGANSTAGA